MLRLICLLSTLSAGEGNCFVLYHSLCGHGAHPLGLRYTLRTELDLF